MTHEFTPSARRAAALAGAALAAFAAWPAQALTVPPMFTSAAYGYDSAGFGSQTVFAEGGQTFLAGNGTYAAGAHLGAGTASAALSVAEVVTGPTANPFGNPQPLASGTVQYDFAVKVSGVAFGDTPDAVPFWIAGFVQESATNYAVASGSLSIRRSPDDPHAVSPAPITTSFASGSCGYGVVGDCGQQALLVAGSIVPYTDFALGEIIRVKLSADARVIPVVAHPDSAASVFVDPVITIDPAYLTAHPALTVQLVTSPLISNVAAVPEPASAALLALGGVVLGALARRRPA